MTINYEKSRFAKTSIKLLGYEISYGVIKPDPDRLLPLLNYPMPSTKKGLQRMLGLLAYYAKWILSFSQRIKPLVHSSVSISPENEQLFHSLIKDISMAARGRIYHDKPLCIETDASDEAIAAILSQDNKPVAFFSRPLNDTEKKHCSLEKEAYAIIEAIRKWSHLLLGRRFTIITDQRSVSFMFADHANKIKNEKIARWRLELMPYKFEVKYRPGRDNVAADAFSRLHCSAIEETETPHVTETNNPTSNLPKLHHDACHPGVTRFWHLVRSRNLPHSLEEVKQMIKSCPTCLAIKHQFMTTPPTPFVSATHPFDRLNMDIK